MQITYNNITIDFWNFSTPAQVILSLSGGADSAALMYLTCKYFPNLEIIPFNCRDVNAPKDSKAAELIVKWMVKEFPNAKIKDIEIFNFNDKDESYVSWKECDEFIKKDQEKYSKLNRIQISKIIQISKVEEFLERKYPLSIKIDGITNNPPVEEMRRLGFYDIAERRRDPSQIKKQIGFNRYQPFINVDKKFIADIYRKNNLMDSLFPLTRSCIGTAATTDNFTKECHLCFWCHEKKWAFNLEWQ